MNTKKISLVVLSLGVCTLAYSAEYKSPKVGLKQASPSHKEVKVAEFNEEYKVEGATQTDRQIASEVEESDREPSSVVAHEKKKVDVVVDEEKSEDGKLEPKPWLYRTTRDANY
ncbi:MAG: hypothetical protein WC635_03835 [Bacteriovorax sp.]|jgi:hypothetical protein